MPHRDLSGVEDQRAPLCRHGSNFPRDSKRNGQAERAGVDAILLFSGSKNVFVEKLTGSLGYDEGISCVACHSIQKTDVQGNANYTMTQPVEYLWQWSTAHTVGARARDFLIRAY